MSGAATWSPHVPRFGAAPMPAPAPRIDADGFAGLYEAHVERIHNHVRARVGDPHLAEDLTAQTFLRAWQSIDRYRPVPGRPFIAWLFTIANNLVIDHYRRRRREVVGVKSDPPAAADSDPERCALNADLREQVRHALSRLKPDHQLVVTLRLIDGLDYAEISAITGKTPGALRVLICRALGSMRAELRACGVGDL